MPGQQRKSVVIGVDIGGTFTDAVCVIDGRQFLTTKTPSTPGNLIVGVSNTIDELLDQAGLSASDITRFAHGTTVATNAVLEKKGATSALLTTSGFEDVLTIGRLRRSKLYDLFLDQETPEFLAPKHLRCGVKERVGADGLIVDPLDEQDLRNTILRLVRDHRVESIGVCYLFSFRNPAHEQRTKEIIAEIAPSVRVSLSSEIDPVFREYERTCVTSMDAYLRPVMEAYIQEVAQMLKDKGISANLEVMQSRGALTTAELAGNKPVSLLLSGPAAGVAGARHTGLQAGFENLLTIDIGGTSSDVSIIAGGRIPLTTEGRIDRYPLRIPMVDINTIGAGGGSVAWLDSIGGLHVGPHSAGAVPGPACYPGGGNEATVTDASLVLGYLNPSYFAGGKIKLDVAASHSAIARLAAVLKMEVMEVAAGIHTIVNSHMSDQIRLMSIGRGFDPRDFVLVLLGGAGPTHGAALLKNLNISTAFVPPAPGVLAASGLLVSQIEDAEAITQVLSAQEVSARDLLSIYADLESKSLIRLKGVLDGEQLPTCARSIDVRYKKQSYELSLDVAKNIEDDTVAAIIEKFHAQHKTLYGHSSSQDEVEFVTFRVTHSIPRKNDVQFAVKWNSMPGGRNSQRKAIKEKRRAYFLRHGWMDTPVYERELIAPGTHVESPAIIEQRDTTTIVYPGQICQMDELGNLIIGNR